MAEGFEDKDSQGVWTATSVDTPSSSAQAASTEVLTQLEFYDTVELAAREAVTEAGAAAVRRRVPISHPAAVAEELDQVAELVRLYDGGGSLVVERVEDLDPILTRIGIEGSVLEPLELLNVARGMESIDRLVRSVKCERERVPLLAARLPSSVPAGPARAILEAIHDDGTVRDGASGELRRTRERFRERRAALIRMLQHRAREISPQSDDAVTFRNGRYVLAVRSDLRTRCGGIIHGQSATGQTLYVEPEDAVEAGNELAELEALEKREVMKVLRKLTDGLRERLDEIAAGWRFHVAADSLLARARFAIAHGGVKPELDETGALRIAGAHHPLLAGRTGTVVPFDLELLPDERVLVVSGPNAGGKTVLLKAIGQLAALTQAGFIPPAAAGTRLPVFRHIFCDIGDHQSIAASLSTFSARLERIKSITNGADDRSLVLLDEVGSGTDPREGAALAAAVLGSLARCGARTVATTHLNELKHLATSNSSVQNASLEFDERTLTPTYRLIKGVPGRSYGLCMAQRIGLKREIVEEAEASLPEAEKSFDQLLQGLEAQRVQLERELSELESERSRLEVESRGLAERRRELVNMQRELAERHAELERNGRKEARRFLLEARKRVEEALGVARAAVDEATARQARRLVEEGIREEARAMERLRELGRLKGWKVGGAGTVPGKDTAGGGPAVKREVRLPEIVAATEVNLRGMRVDDARRRLTEALDAAVVQDLPMLRIIHGKGTGALKALVREILDADQRVASHRQAPVTEGGAGVTIAELAG